MINITKKKLNYVSSELDIPVQHFILIHDGAKQSTLLSHVNLFLYRCTRASLKTSSRYASAISMFYRYLSTQKEFLNRAPSLYYLFATNKNINRWQTSRERRRVARNAVSPSTETIFEDAKLLMNFFRWLGDAGFATSVNIQLRTWIPPYKSSRYQQYVSLMAKNVIDATSISVLDKLNRQSSYSGLVSPGEIRELLENYNDPVYSALFYFALGTAMRPMDLCKFPYFGNGENRHIMPFSSMNLDLPTTQYTINDSKGKKTRTIIIHRDALKDLEENYIAPYYAERAKKYLNIYGKKPPLSILFLNKDGHPVTPDKIASRTTAAKKKILKTNPNLRPNLRFYDSRDWWPTQYLIRCFGDELLKSNEGLYNLAIAQILQSQMGHSQLKTTFTHYIDMARVVLSIHKGRRTEILKAADYKASDFIGLLIKIEDESEISPRQAD
ncbi:site-specific integrase [Pseudomonas sp. TWRC1-2]|uniref:site-specific integrase n=1 Tax=Pseudomonas sp. TWRC1-2 TaxID=2804628 RepID=UPI003CEEDB0F